MMIGMHMGGGEGKRGVSVYSPAVTNILLLISCIMYYE